MRRRDFVRAIVGSATAWPLTLRAQQNKPKAMRRIAARDELAPPHSITSSATARSCGRNVNRLTDSVAAVFALVGVQLLVVSFCYFQYRKILAAVPS